MTVMEAIYRVKTALNVQTDDSTIRNRYVFSVLKSVRSELIRQESNKSNLWNGGSCQYLPGRVLKRSTISEALGFKSDIIVYKGIDALPTFIDTKFGKVILGVYFANGDKIDTIEFSDWEARRNRRWKLGDASFFLRNNKPYVVGYEGGDEIEISVEGIYNDPEVVEVLKNPEAINTYIGDLVFDMPSYLERRIFDLAIIEVGRKFNIQPDTKNDGTEDVKGTVQPVSQPSQQQNQQNG